MVLAKVDARDTKRPSSPCILDSRFIKSFKQMPEFAAEHGLAFEVQVMTGSCKEAHPCLPVPYNYIVCFINVCISCIKGLWLKLCQLK
eukprot:1141273-Pelagomonas_calceolata.AAC.2